MSPSRLRDERSRRSLALCNIRNRPDQLAYSIALVRHSETFEQSIAELKRNGREVFSHWIYALDLLIANSGQSIASKNDLSFSKFNSMAVK